MNLRSGGISRTSGLFTPFAEFRFESTDARRLRLGTSLESAAVDLGILRAEGGLLVRVYGEHLVRPAATGQYRLGISASYPRR